MSNINIEFIRTFTNHALRGVGLAILTMAACRDAVAQDADSKDPAFIIVGPVRIPEYYGSKDYEVVPAVISQFAIEPVHVEIEGLTAYFLFGEPLHWRLGLATELDMGRDDETTNTIVASMEELELAFNVGAIIDYVLPDLLLDDDEFEAKLTTYTDANDVHDGVYSTLNLSYTLPLMIPWRFEFEFETTYADSNYMDTYFGVNEINSLRSGLPLYTAGDSLRDATLISNIILFFNPKFGVFTRLGFTQLLGDAKDSPIVEQGDDQQYFIGLGLFYRFGG